MDFPPSPMRPCADLFPDDYTKRGAGALAETAASDVVGDPARMDNYFKRLAVGVRTLVTSEGATGDWQRAKITRQATDAVGSYAVNQLAMPRMTAWHQEHGNLHIPDDWLFDTRLHLALGRTEPHTELHATALRGAFWIVDAGRTFLQESSADASHPFHRLHHYMEQAWQGYVDAFEPYREEQDQRELRRNRDPEASARAATTKRGGWQDTSYYTYEHAFVDAHLSNVGVALDMMTAGAIHHVIHGGGHRVEDLAAGALERLPLMRWSASIDRHNGARKAEQAGLQVQPLPDNATNLLGQQLLQAESVAELTAPFLSYRMVNDEEFCTADILRSGPPSKTSSCSGDVNTRIATAADQRASTAFFAEIGLPGFGQSTLSSATVTLGVGMRQAVTLVYPRLAAFLESASA